MKFNEKLRELRLAQKLTQEEVATHLGVTSQSVSKWERGILSPDIHLLPRIALLYRTSIDALFDMAFYWGEQHESDFQEQIKALAAKGDIEGVWNAYVTEIDLCPDRFEYYVEIMFHSLRAKMFDDERVSYLMRLADYADRHCHNDDRRNEIHRLMVQICGSSENKEHRAKARQYYMQLPLLRHSREVYAKFVLSEDAYVEQLKKSILYSVDIAECAVRQMVSSNMSCDEKLYLYKRAAALYEAVLDGRFAGLYDVPLLCDYANMAMLLFDMGRFSESKQYIRKMLDMLERFIVPEKQMPTALFVVEPYVKGVTSPDISCMKLIRGILDREAFAEHRHELVRISQSLEEQLHQKTKDGACS